MAYCFYKRTSFTSRSRGMTVTAVTSSTADSSFLILPLLFGRHFKSFILLSFSHFEAVFSPPSPPFFLASAQTVLTLYYLNPLYFLATRKQKCFHEVSSPAVSKFAPKSYSFVVGADNQRCILTCLLLPPINFAGFLAAAPGHPRTMQLWETAPFSAAYLLRWHNSRKHKCWNIIKTNPENRFITFDSVSLTFKLLTSFP